MASEAKVCEICQNCGRVRSGHISPIVVAGMKSWGLLLMDR
jgi:hypothetical protein